MNTINTKVQGRLCPWQISSKSFTKQKHTMGTLRLLMAFVVSFCSVTMTVQAENAEAVNASESYDSEESCGTISGVHIYDQSSDQSVYGPIQNGDQIALSSLPAQYYLVTEVSGNIESVRFQVDGYDITENTLLYTFPSGAENGNSWAGSVGIHNLTATAYSLDNKGGQECGSLSLQFELTGSTACDAPLTIDQWNMTNGGTVCNDDFASTIDSHYQSNNLDLISFGDPTCADACVSGVSITFNLAACDYSNSSSNPSNVNVNYPIELNGVVIGHFNPTELPCTYNVCESGSNHTQFFTIDPNNFNKNGNNVLDLNFVDYSTNNGGLQHICVANLVLDFTTSPCGSSCDNVTDPGSIYSNNMVCAGTPITINSSSLPSGGSGAIEYVWLVNPNEASFDGATAIISNTPSLTISPTESGWYRRCARRSGCEDYDGETNWVHIQAENCGIVAPSAPTCSAGALLWQNNVDINNLSGSYGIPQSDVRFVDGSTTIFCIPGPYPAAFNSAVTLNIDEAVSWDGYNYRVNVNQDYEQWKIIFKKDGVVQYESQYTPDIGDNAFSSEWSGALDQNIFLPNGTDEICLVHIEDDTYGEGSFSSANSVVPSSVCISAISTCDLTVDLGPDRSTCGQDVALTPTVSGLTDCPETCEYQVSPPDRCQDGNSFVFYINNAPGGSAFSSNDATFVTHSDGTAQFQATATNGTDNVVVDITYSNYTTTSPSDSPKENICETTNTAGWSYYQTTTGTVVSENHGSYTVSRRGPSFQLGNTAMHIAPGFGGSGWFNFHGGDGTYIHGDVNVKLSETCTTVTNNDLSYEWSNGATTESISVSQSGTYSVTVTDCNGCTASDNVTVTITDAPVITPIGLDDNEITVECGSDFPAVTFNNGTVTSYEEYSADKVCKIDLSTHPNYNWTNFWFHQFPEAYNKHFVWSDGYVIINDDQTVELKGKVENVELPGSGFLIHYYFETLQNHSDWIAGGGYANGDSEAANRQYAAVDFNKPNSIVGYGEFANSDLQLTSAGDLAHMDIGPRNVYGGYGFGFWIDYEGTVNGMPAGTSTGLSGANHNDMYSALNECSSDLGNDCYQRVIREWTVEDACGVECTFIQSVILEDSQAPTLINSPEDMTISCNEGPGNDMATFDDACDEELDVDFTENSVTNNDGSVTITRTWVATDDCDNSTTHVQTITVAPCDVNVGDYVWYDNNQDGIQDANEPPVPGVTVNLIGPGPDGLFHTADDVIVDTQVTDGNGLYLFEDVTPGTYCIEFLASTLPADYVFTAQNQGGNDATDSDVDPVGKTDSFTVVAGAEDDLTYDAGIYTCQDIIVSSEPADMTISCDETVPAPVEPTFTDGFGTAISVAFSETVNDLDCGEEIIRTWTGTSQCGESLTVDQVISIVDTESPVIAFTPEDVTISCNDPLPSLLFQFQDNCDFNLELTMNTETQDLGCGNVMYTFTQTATDDCGNSVSGSVSVTRIDDEGPAVVSGPADMNLSCEETVPAPEAPVFEDACDGDVTVTFDEQTSTDNNAVTTVTRTWTATDECGNSTTYEQTITIAPCDVNVGNYVWYDNNQDGIQDADELPVEGVSVNLIGPGPDGIFHTADDVIVDTQVTDENGLYLFTSVDPGTYCIEFLESTIPADFVFTAQDQGGNDETDSDVNETGKTTSFTVVAGQDDDLTWDAGIYNPVNVGDFVWYDDNQDGIQDPNELPVSGVTVTLIGPGPDGLFHTADDEIIDTQVTDSNGEYLFEDVAPGDYCIEFIEATIPSDYVFTAQDQGGDDAEDSDVDENGKTTSFTVVGGQDDDLTWDAGIYEPVNVGDFVWNDVDQDGIQDADEEPVPGVTVTLIGPGPDGIFHTADDEIVDTQVTDSNGEYLFEDVVPGTYCIEFLESTIPADFVFTAQDQGGNDAQDSDVDESGKTTSFTVTGGQDDDLTWDAGIYLPVNVGNYVWYDNNQDGIQDSNELPVEGVTVVLYGPGPDGLFHTADDITVDTQVTDADGLYLFEDVDPGMYCIEFIEATLPTDFVFTNADQGGDDTIDSDASENGKTLPFTVTGGQDDDLTWDAGIYEPINVGDYVWYDVDQDGIQDPNESPVEGVTVTLIGPGPDGIFHTADDEIVDTQVTDANGEYLFEDVAPGTYCIEFIESTLPADFIFTAQDQGGDDTQDSDVDEDGKTSSFTVTGGQDDDLTWDAGIYSPVNVGDFVWYDNDFDGVQDPNEAPVEGVTVNLIGPGPDGLFHTADDVIVDTQITDTNGEYLFEDVAPGTYCIEFDSSTLPNDYFFTAQNQGGDDAQDSDVDADGKTTSFTVTGGQGDALTWDAGIYSPVNIGNYVWFDDNQNGIQDPSENPVSGVTVQLYGPGPDGLFHTADDILIDTQVTDPNGEYLFEDVDPGMYCIQFVESTIPADYFFTSGNQGADDSVDSDVDGAGKTGAFNVVSGQDDDLTWDAGITTCSDITVEPMPAPLNLECDETVPAPVEPNFVDPFDDNLTVTYSEVTNQLACGYEIVRTWTATNYCGNIMTANQVVTVTDTQAPVITFAPQDVVISCNDPLPALIFQFQDNCDNSLSLSTESESQVLNDCGDIEYTFTHTATDDCGNSVSGSVKVTIVDDEAPVLIAPADLEADITCEEADYPTALEYIAGTLTAMEAHAFEASIGQIFAQSDIIPLGVTDNCDDDVAWEAQPLQIDYNVSCPIKAKLICQFVAVDDCGNVSDTLTTVVNIVDQEAPVLEGVPADITMSCGEAPAPANVIATEDCSTVLDVIYTEDIQSASCPISIIRTWTAIDGCGNETSASQTITISDTEAPVLSGVPADVSGECADIPVAPVVTATDNCGDVDVVFSENDQSVGCNINIVRTWTATDACGNVSTQSQSIIFNDSEAPVLSGVPADISGQCGPIPVPADVQGSDNCADIIVEFAEVNQSSGCIVDITRTWTATDDCGNTTSQSQTIYYEDTTAPQMIAPADITVDCADMDLSPAITGLASAVDNCDDDVDMNFVDGPITGNCPSSFVRSWTATDGCCNTATHDQTITIVDETAPVIAVPGNVTIDCSASTAVSANGNATATDACGDVTISHVDGPMSTTCPYSFTRTFTATDACGNTSTGDQIITIEDNTATTVVSAPADLVGDCSNGNIPTDAATFADNCDDNLSVVYAEQNNDLSCGYEVVRTWTATDACGNSVTATQTVTFNDIVNPAFTNAPANATVQCEAIPAPAQLTATDNCDNAVEVTYNGQTTTTGCPFTITRSWTATDDCGNSADHTQVITVEDNTSPQMIGVPADITAQCGAVPAAAIVSAIDNCDDNVQISMEEQTMSASCPQIIVRTWTAIDACGNIATAQQTITYDDTQAPTIAGPADAVLDCSNADTDVSTTGMASATDNCDDEVAITFVDGPVSGDCPQSFVRTFTATDGCGNISTAQQTITIVDETAPSLTAPADITIECTDITAPINTGQAIATDACSGLQVSFTDGPVNGTCPSSFNRTWVATDGCGNVTEAIQVITIIDTQAPTVSNAPADVSYECNENIPSADATFVDNCDSNPTVSFNEANNDLGCGFELVRTWTATDACGNSTSHVQTITVIDTQAPAFTNAPANVTVECINIPAVEAVSATDNCDANVVVTYNGQTQTSGCPFTITRSWTAVDECGNTVDHSQVITVVDTTAPELLNVPASVSVDCGSIPAAATVSAIDNCDDDVQISFNEETSEGDCPYTITRTWTATDACGNETLDSQVITVSDTQAPVFEDHEAQLTILCDQLDSVTIPVTDDCSEVEVSVEDVTFSGSCYGTIERTFTATDACGNSSTTVIYLFLTDEVSPQFTSGPSDMQIDCGEPIPAVQTPVAIDNCDDELDYEFTEIQSGTDCPYVITRTWTATDECGNEAIYIQTITVVTNVATDNILSNAYPNPFDNNLTLSFVVPEDGFVVFEVYNQMGQVVETIFKGYALGGIEYQFTISSDSWSDGSYTSRLIMDESVQTTRIVKNK